MIKVISFGYGHRDPETGELIPPPVAHFTLDVRTLFRDPHVDPALREMTGRDQLVVDKVMNQPGAYRAVSNLAMMTAHLQECTEDVTVAVGCVGGRHRSYVIAQQVAERLQRWGMPVKVEHRDVDKPVIKR